MNAELAKLDRWLKFHGEPIFLRRTVGTTNQSYVQCRVPAIVKPLTVEQLVGAISQQNYFIIISPTHIIRAQWPGGKTPASAVSGGIIAPSDPRIPSMNDFVYLRGGQKAVTRTAPVFDRGECIRIELTVLG
jgi:hypothetical protein